MAKRQVELKCKTCVHLGWETALCERCVHKDERGDYYEAYQEDVLDLAPQGASPRPEPDAARLMESAKSFAEELENQPLGHDRNGTDGNTTFELQLEPGVRDIVKALRRAGVNTECSCEHDGYIQCQTIDPTEELSRIYNVLIGEFGMQVDVEMLAQTHDGHWYRTLNIRLPKSISRAKAEEQAAEHGCGDCATDKGILCTTCDPDDEQAFWTARTCENCGRDKTCLILIVCRATTGLPRPPRLIRRRGC